MYCKGTRYGADGLRVLQGEERLQTAERGKGEKEQTQRVSAGGNGRAQLGRREGKGREGRGGEGKELLKRKEVRGVISKA